MWIFERKIKPSMGFFESIQIKTNFSFKLGFFRIIDVIYDSFETEKRHPREKEEHIPSVVVHHGHNNKQWLNK